MICKCGKDLKIEGDQIQLKEVFNNLLNNAYEAFDDKGGRIEIKAQASKVYLTVRIKDNGPGVDPKAMGKIFEPFFTTKVRGMGLGLPLCSQIISLHNGTIKMTSKPGKGAAIEVKLPIQPKVEKSQKKVV
jgi:signal transduction histidine kinase